MSGPLAVPTFVTGARDEVAATDVYTQTSSAPINNVQVVDDSKKINLAAALRGGKSLLKDIQLASSLAKRAQALAKGQGNLLGRLGSLSGLLAGGLKSLVPGISGDILKGITSAGDLLKTGTGIYATVKNVSKAIQTGKFTDVASISSLINNVTNASTVVLRDANAGLGSIAGLIGTAQTFKIPNTFEALCGSLDIPSINKIGLLTLPSCITSSDIGSLASMANLCSPGTLKMANVNVVADFMKKYTVDPGKPFPEITSDYSKMKEVFTKIDPPWATSPRATINNFETIPSIVCVQSASQDFLDTMHAGVKTDPNSPDRPLLLGAVFPKTDVMTEIKKQFPSFVPSAEPTPNASEDPRVIPISTKYVGTSSILNMGGGATRMQIEIKASGSTTTTTSGGGSTVRYADGSVVNYAPPSVSFADQSPAAKLDQSTTRNAALLTQKKADIEKQLAKAIADNNTELARAEALTKKGMEAVASGANTSVSQPFFEEANYTKSEADRYYRPLIVKLQDKLSQITQDIANPGSADW